MTKRGLNIMWLAGSGFALLAALPVNAAEERVATFAGGCFWCVEKAEEVPGVREAVLVMLRRRRESHL